MADNYTTNPGTGGSTFASDDIGGVQFPRVKLVLGGDGVNDGDASATNPLATADIFTNPSANFTRPADTTAYAAGDLVANSTTAGSVSPMSLTVARNAAGSFLIHRLKLHKSGTGTTNAIFRAHLFRATTTVVNGDNGALSMAGVANYLGSVDIAVDQAFTDGAAGFSSLAMLDMAVKLASGQAVFALLEARATYTPVSAEVFTLTAEVVQN